MMTKFKKGDIIAYLNSIGKIDFVFLILEVNKTRYNTILLFYSGNIKGTALEKILLYIEQVDKCYTLYEEKRHGKI